MSGTTTNLQLFKYNPNTDGDQTFNIDEALNNNFDKLDTVIGALANLTTEQKTNLVAAINEIITNLGEKSSIDLDNLSSIGQGILDAKIEAEALTAQNGYIKFKLNGISNPIILQWGGAIAQGTSTNIIFPISFTQTEYKIFIGVIGVSPNSNFACATRNDSTTQVKYTQSLNSNTGIMYFAIGY